MKKKVSIKRKVIGGSGRSKPAPAHLQPSAPQRVIPKRRIPMNIDTVVPKSYGKPKGRLLKRKRSR